MGFAASLASVIVAAATLMNTAFDTVKPNMDIEGTLFLINRQYRITDSYIPEVRQADVSGKVREMRADAAAALEAMFAACKEEAKVTLVTVSGYRSYQTQKTLYSRKLQNVKGSYARADQYVARAGASEHQLGLAMDVGQKGKGSLTASFRLTKGGQWLKDNCWRFGFVIRYGETWQDITGYKYEPWHVRYVGKEYAQSLHEADVPMETWLLSLREERLLDILSGVE